MKEKLLNPNEGETAVCFICTNHCRILSEEEAEENVFSNIQVEPLPHGIRHLCITCCREVREKFESQELLLKVIDEVQKSHEGKIFVEDHPDDGGPESGTWEDPAELEKEAADPNSRIECDLCGDFVKAPEVYVEKDGKYVCSRCHPKYPTLKEK